MAKPNISLLGATYSGVAGVTLPKSGGGTATFPWVEGSETKTENGTYDVTNLAELVVNVSGGGGASNVVTGTFKGTTTGTAMDVTLNYTGSGYPVAVMIYPTEGPYNSTTGSFYSLVQRYALQSYVCIKQSTNTTPTYPNSSTSDDENKSVYLCRYKASSSSATTYQTTGGDIYNYRDTNSSDSTSRYVMLRSKTKMSVFIANTSRGFAANIEYKYWVLYSS